MVRHPGIDQLTKREREVLLLVGRGLMYGQIATELGLSTETVKVHVTNARRKLGNVPRQIAAELIAADALLAKSEINPTDYPLKILEEAVVEEASGGPPTTAADRRIEQVEEERASFTPYPLEPRTQLPPRSASNDLTMLPATLQVALLAVALACLLFAADQLFAVFRHLGRWILTIYPR